MCESIKFLEKIIGKMLQVVGISKDFLAMTQEEGTGENQIYIQSSDSTT